jgi:hypothetical protein
MKIRAMLGLDELKAPNDVVNGWRGVAIDLKQLY